MFDKNKFLKGTSGEVFLNKTKMIEINKINIKMAGQFEDFAPVGDYCTHHVYTGFDGSGTMSGVRINSGIDTELIEAYQKGEVPDIEIVSNLGNPNTGAVESYMLTGVQFSEITPVDWEAKKLVLRDMPFTFTGIKQLSKIE